MRSDRDSGIWRALILSWATVIVVGFLVWTEVRAQAGALLSPVARSTVGLVERQWVRRGFVPHDPRFIASQSAYSTAVGGAASNVLVVAGGALLLGTPIGWGTLATAALVGAALPVAVELFLGPDATMITLNPDGTYTATAIVSFPRDPALPQGQCLRRAGGGGPSGCFASGSALAAAHAPATVPNYHTSARVVWFAPGRQYPAVSIPASSSPFWNAVNRAARTCETSTVYGCIAFEYVHLSGTTYHVHSDNVASMTGTPIDPPPTTQTQTRVSADTLLSTLPPAVLDSPLTQQAEAQLANRLWQAASAADPAVIPYSPSDAITPQDVASYRAANPGTAPTVRQFLSDPALVLGQPMPRPTTTTSTPSTPVAGSGTPMDLGADPQIGPPDLEDTPDAGDILSPILNLGGDLRNIVITPQPSQCPVAAFDVFGETYSIDAHCALIDPYRPIIQGAMMLVWLLLAAYAVLRA